MRRGIYQGWVGWRNLGDEAMFQACCRCLPRIRWMPMALEDGQGISGHRFGWGNRWLGRIAWPSRDVALMGGGTTLNRTAAWLEEYRHLRRMVRRPVPVFSPGVADPSFWSQSVGWRDTRAEWREELASLPEVGVRGPLSKRLLDEAGFDNALVTGDPGLAFHRGPLSVPNPGRRAVALNVGRSMGRMWGSEDRAVGALADGARRLAAAGFDVRVFPVWDQDMAVCYEVARVAGLPMDAVDPLLVDADAFLQYADRFDVLISLKLHAGVLAAAAGVPFVAVEYRPKVRDFAESLGWTQFTFRSDVVEGADLERAVREINDDLSRMRDRLGLRVGELAETFRAYARRLEDFLLAS